MVRKKTRELLNGYLDLPQFTTNDGLGRYIFEIVWVDRAVLVGKFDLALGAMKKNRKTETMTRKEVTVAMVKVSVVIMPKNGGKRCGCDAGCRGGGGQNKPSIFWWCTRRHCVGEKEETTAERFHSRLRRGRRNGGYSIHSIEQGW